MHKRRCGEGLPNSSARGAGNRHSRKRLLDDEGRAGGELYEDDGASFDYLEGAFRLTRFEAEARGRSVRLALTVDQGDWKAATRAIDVRIVGNDGMETRATWNSPEPALIPLD